MDFEVIASGYQFVEAPRVDAVGRVWFSDLLGKGLYRTTPGGQTEGFLLERPWIGGLALAADGSVLCGGRGGLMRLDPATDTLAPVVTALDGLPIIAINDLEPLPDGSVVAGTIDFVAIFERGEAPGPGALFHAAVDGTVTVFREGVYASNGFATSADGRLLYHSETGVGINAYAIGSDGRPHGAPMTFATLKDSDGIAVDAEGGVWCACWRSARLLHFRADGTQDQEHALPFDHVTSVAFGGPAQEDLYVAVAGNVGKGRLTHGGVIRVRPPVPGLPVALARV